MRESAKFNGLNVCHFTERTKFKARQQNSTGVGLDAHVNVSLKIGELDKYWSIRRPMSSRRI